jgi:O-antigen/teichoic acid export membrane protein
VAGIADPLLRLMYGAKYLPAIPVLTILAIFGLTLAASATAQFLLVAADKQVFYLIWMLTSGLVDVAGNLVLVPRFGAMGAAYAKGFAQFIGATGFLVFMVRHFKVSLPFARIARLVAVSAVMFLTVRFVGRHLHPVPGLIIGIPVGAVIFGVLLRLARCLDETDRDRLGHLASLLPSRARAPYRAVIRYLVPARPDLSAVPSATNG